MSNSKSCLLTGAILAACLTAGAQEDARAQSAQLACASAAISVVSETGGARPGTPEPVVTQPGSTTSPVPGAAQPAAFAKAAAAKTANAAVGKSAKETHAGAIAAKSEIGKTEGGATESGTKEGGTPQGTGSASGQTQTTSPNIISPTTPPGAPTPPPLRLNKGFVPFGTIRLREEDFNWFPATKANGAYSFLGGFARVGVARATRTDDVVVEFTAPFLVGLPTRAIAPAPEGMLGTGASYRDANHNQVAGFYLKNGYVRFKNVGSPANSVRLGRFEFSDGVETTSADASLAFLKQNRIGQRLLGPAGYTNAGRSFDGIQAVNNTRLRNLSVSAMMPTRGVYDLNGWDTLADIRVLYANAAYPQPGPHASGEGRLFAIYYEDVRDGAVVKTDNRPLATPAGVAVRTADKGNISIGTFGGNYERVEPLGDGKIDGLFWGAAQVGRWGALRQGAFAFAAEAGYQPKFPALKPWLRVGYNYFSGDGNNANGVHGTFIPLLPTTRQYARFPFFAEANLKDAFGQLILRPNPRLTLRTDVHSLRLADSHDLWYTGTGAGEIRNFGYAGRPSNGHSNLAMLYDISADYMPFKALTLSLYFAYADGGDVIKSIYRSTDATFAYAEATFHF